MGTWSNIFNFYFFLGILWGLSFLSFLCLSNFQIANILNIVLDCLFFESLNYNMCVIFVIHWFNVHFNPLDTWFLLVSYESSSLNQIQIEWHCKGGANFHFVFMVNDSFVYSLLRITTEKRCKLKSSTAYDFVLHYFCSHICPIVKNFIPFQPFILLCYYCFCFIPYLIPWHSMITYLRIWPRIDWNDET